MFYYDIFIVAMAILPQGKFLFSERLYFSRIYLKRFVSLNSLTRVNINLKLPEAIVKRTKNLIVLRGR